MPAEPLGYLGWVATAMTVASYFCRSARTLRIVQAVAALVWLWYGVVIGAMPIVAANVLVAGVAGWTTWRGIGKVEETAKA